MSDHDTDTPKDEEPTEAELAELEGAPLAALLKRALPEEDADDAALLAGVQEKLRKRSRGKFYGDGWSTSRTSVSYAVIAAVMLATILAIYLALGPTGFQ